MDTRRNGRNGQTLKSICLKGQETAYLLKRSARRTLGLRIDREGLTVSAPLKMPEKMIEGLLREKSGWILRKIEEAKPPPSREWKEGESLPFLGRNLLLRVSGSSREEMEIRIDGECLLVFLPDPSRVQAIVESWYKRQALEFFADRIMHYCPRLNVAAPKLFLSNAKTRWGSCNSRREIRLNWRLLCMEPEIIDYVVVHELSHLIEMNHSKAFWNTVESVYPSYECARKELRRIARGALW